MKKKDSVKRITPAQAKYDALVIAVKKFVDALQNRKSTTAFLYKASEQPAAIVPGAPPQQFNVLEVRQLITQVLTARNLGYETRLDADGDKLVVIFSEKYPFIPINLQYLP
jgi:hypothetical protein